MDSIIIHTLVCYSILSCIHNHHIAAVHMSQDCMAEMGQGPGHLIITLVIATQLYSQSLHALRFPVLPMQASRLASKDHLMCMIDLACSGELESVHVLAS